MDDPERALRLDAPSPTGTDNVQLDLVVPADLPLATWSLSLRAEVLSDDQQRVESVVYSRVRDAATVPPVFLQLTGPAAVKIVASQQQPEEWLGRIERREGTSGPVKVYLKGLPDNVKGPELTLPAEENQFALPARFEGEIQGKDLSSLRLVASIASAVDEGVQVESNEVPVSAQLP